MKKYIIAGAIAIGAVTAAASYVVLNFVAEKSVRKMTDLFPTAKELREDIETNGVDKLMDELASMEDDDKIIVTRF